LFRKKKTTTSRLPNLYGQTLIQSEYNYRRDIRLKLDQLQHDNRDIVRRRLASNHIFAQDHLAKRYNWFMVDKSYRDRCRTIWNRQAVESGRTSHVFLPDIYSSANCSPLTMASITTLSNPDEEENPAVTDARIKQDFLSVQPVMLELLRAPHSSKALKNKHELQLRQKSAQKRHVQIQKAATNDKRFTRLVGSLHEV
jgi:hypothetical protein